MPQEFLDDFGICAQRLDQSRERMPKSVPANFLVDAGPPCCRLDVVPHHGGKPEGLPSTLLWRSPDPIGIGAAVDWSHDWHSVAFCLRGGSQNDDLYVMINAYWQELQFQVQESSPKDCVRIVDTALPSGDDFSESGVPLQQTQYQVAPRSVVLLARRRSH
jgi:hypothetical protein